MIIIIQKQYRGGIQRDNYNNIYFCAAIKKIIKHRYKLNYKTD